MNQILSLIGAAWIAVFVLFYLPRFLRARTPCPGCGRSVHPSRVNRMLRSGGSPEGCVWCGRTRGVPASRPGSPGGSDPLPMPQVDELGEPDEPQPEHFEYRSQMGHVLTIDGGPDTEEGSPWAG